MFNRVYLCLQLFTRAYLLTFTHDTRANLCLLMLTYFYHFSGIYLCLPLFTCAYLPMFSHG